MKTIATKLGLPEDAAEEQILAAIGELQGSVENCQKKEADRDADDILNRHADRIPEGAKEEWKGLILANRETALKLLEKLPATAAPEGRGRPAITNRETAGVPSADRAHGADAAPRQRAEVLKIQNREKCSFARAWEIAKLEQPALFA